MTFPLLGCLAAILGLGLVERLARDRSWRSVPIRIHVNGTRGKSTVTRLIWSALREAGIPALGKTTGTAARLLLPDGSEHPVARRSSPSIREQLRAMRLARRAGARAAVLECMALHPELQWISEREMVRATIGVITNVRLDHTEIMGQRLDEVAATLANTIPRSGVLVTGDEAFLPLFSERAARYGSRVLSSSAAARDLAARPAPGLPPVAPWLAQDTAIALTVTRELRIPDEVARRGFARAPADPGAVREGTLKLDADTVLWLDATAANDPLSLETLTADDGRPEGVEVSRDVVVYNHREDRGARLDCFSRESKMVSGAAHLLVTGARPPLTVIRQLRRARGTRATEFVPRRVLAERLRRQAPGSRLVFCGNTRGLDVPRLIEEIEARG